jgi:hypothetical protein
MEGFGLVYTANRHINGTVRVSVQQSRTIFVTYFCLWPKLRSLQRYHDSTSLLLKMHLASLLVAPGLRTIQFLYLFLGS